jgi:hypothetical protein
MSRTEAERMVVDIVGVTGDLVHERRLSIAQTYIDTLRVNSAAVVTRRQLEAAAHEAASLEDRLKGMIDSLNGGYQEPAKLTVDDIEVLLDVRGLHMNINSRITPRERAVFDRLYALLDERLLVRRKV